MIKFLFSNKKRRVGDAITDMLAADASQGISSVLIVPEQEAVNAERMTLDRLPASAQLSLEVLSFSRLYNRVCREYGGLCYSYITTPLKSLMIWKTLRELTPLLGEYSKNASSDPAFAATMLRSIAELRSSCITPAMLEAAANECDTDNRSLASKLRDIALIYGTYDLHVGQKYSDSADDLSRLCDILSENDFFGDKNVYIYSFTSFTSLEHRVIERIFKSAKNTVISVPLPSPEYSDISTAGIEDSLRTLKKNAGKWGGAQAYTLEDCNDTGDIFGYLGSHLWELDKASSSDELPCSAGRIVMEICEDTYGECEATASHILELLQNGARCRDITVIMRDVGKYRGIIEPALERACIPHFISEKTDICTLAPIKFILSAIRIKQYNWQKNDVISHIKTGLCDFSLHDADIFEEYINTWNISGNRFHDGDWTMNPDGFTDKLTDRGRDILSVSNAVRQRLCEPLSELFILLDASDGIADMCRALYKYMQRIDLGHKILKLAAKELSFGNKKTASELAAVYNTILKALADIGECLEDTRVSVEDFYTVLKTVFDNTDIGTIPTSIDEVTVGSASLIRTQAPRYVFVLGLCEGEFPANVDDNGLLSTTEKNTLAELDVHFDSNEDIRSSDELLYVKNAFSAPSERLYLLCHTSDFKGNKRPASLPFRRVAKLFSDVVPHMYTPSDLSYLAGTPQSAAAHLRTINDAQDKLAARAAVAVHLPLADKLSEASVSTAECRLSPLLVRRIIGDRIYISPTSLEKYVKCPFSYFASYMLSLRETKRGRFEANNIGTFIHYVMEHIVRFAVPADRDQSLPSLDEVYAETEKIVARYIEMISPDEALKTKRMEHIYKRLCKLSVLIVKSIVKEFSDCDFRPAFFEFQINGDDGNPSPVVLPLENGASVVLKGFIDRVDIWKSGDEVYVRIVDYKTGSKSFSLSELDYGLNTQMLLYLLSVCTSPGTKLREYTGLSNGAPLPAGVVYLSSDIPKAPLSDFSATEEQILNTAEQKIRRSGIIIDNEDVIRAISHSGSEELLFGITEKDGVYTGKALMTSDALDELFSQIHTTLTDIGERIYSGVADCEPIQLKGQDPCKYCKVKQLCRKIDA